MEPQSPDPNSPQPTVGPPPDQPSEPGVAGPPPPPAGGPSVQPPVTPPVTPPLPGQAPAMPGPASQPPLPGQPAPMGSTPLPSAPKGKPKGLLIAIGVVILLIVIALVGYFLIAKSSAITYKSSDATEFQTETYSAAHPKQWEDATDSDYVKESMEDSGDDDSVVIKAFAYKMGEDTKYAKSWLITSSLETGLPDEQLEFIAGSEDGRAAFDEEMSSSFAENDPDDECESIENESTKVNYTHDTFIVLINYEADCKLKDEHKEKTGYETSKRRLTMGMVNGKGYMIAIETGLEDWKRNEAFYNDSILASLKPL